MAKEIEPLKSERTIKATVNRGHSVHVPLEGAPRVHAGWSRGGDEPKEVFRAPFRVALPGEVVELPESEVKRLRKLGFLVDPDKIAAPVEGPGSLQ